MNIQTDLEARLADKASRLLGGDYDLESYANWVENLRIANKIWHDLNQNKYGSVEYIDSCLNIGEYNEALANADRLGDEKVIERVRQAIPAEILDLTFLKKYMYDNWPESTMPI